MKPTKRFFLITLVIVIVGLLIGWQRQTLLALAESSPIVGPVVDAISDRFPLSDSPESMTPNSICPKLENAGFVGFHTPSGTVGQLNRSAEVIVVATVLDQGPVYDFYQSIGADVSYQGPNRDLRFKTEAILKGNIGPEFSMPYTDGELPAAKGRPNAKIDHMPGEPTFDVGSRYVIFLKRGFIGNPVLDTPKSKAILQPVEYASWFKVIDNAVCPVAASSIAAYRASYQVFPKKMDDIKLALGGVEAKVPATPTSIAIRITPSDTTPTPFVAGPTPKTPPTDSP